MGFPILATLSTVYLVVGPFFVTPIPCLAWIGVTLIGEFGCHSNSSLVISVVTNYQGYCYLSQLIQAIFTYYFGNWGTEYK